MEISLADALTIMGRNGVTPEESESVFGAIAPENQRRVRGAMFHPRTLERCATSHALALDKGTCMVMMGHIFPYSSAGMKSVGQWHERNEFARRIESSQYRLIPLTQPACGFGKTKREHDELMNRWNREHPKKTVCIPSARQVMFATMLLWNRRKIALLPPGVQIRTQDTEKNVRAVVIGPFADGRLTVSTADHEDASPTLGTMLFPNHRWYRMPD